MKILTCCYVAVGILKGKYMGPRSFSVMPLPVLNIQGKESWTGHVRL